MTIVGDLGGRHSMTWAFFMSVAKSGIYRAGLRSAPEGDPIVTSDLRSEPDEVWFGQSSLWPRAVRWLTPGATGGHPRSALPTAKVFTIGEFRAL